MDGYIPTENIRTRAEPLKFKQGESADDMIAPKTRDFSYPAMTKTLGGFKLEVEAGGFSDSEIVVLVGENGMGKTTFVQMLAGKYKPDNEKDADMLGFKVSLKPQTSKRVHIVIFKKIPDQESSIVFSLTEVPGYRPNAAAEEDQGCLHGYVDSVGSRMINLTWRYCDVDPTFNTEVIKPMQLEVLMDQEVQT